MTEQLLYELAVRLLTPTYPGIAVPEQAQLFVGALPDALPVEVPLPEQATIVGSVVRGGMMGTEIVLDVAQRPEAILDFYTQRMGEAGWRREASPAPYGGFTDGLRTLLFCRGRRGPALQVYVHSQPDYPSDVRLHLHTDPHHSPCSYASFGQSHDPFHLLPRLMPPSNSRQEGGGGSSGADAMHTTTTLETHLDLADVAAHYNRQFEQAGWQPTGQGVQGPVAWSNWRVRDEEGEPWEGLFTVLRLADTNRYMLQVHMRWAED